MKTNKIRVTELNSECFTKGKEYDVIRWERCDPVCEDDYGDVVTMNNSKWEPVTQFKHGDPVWAWDDDKEDMKKGIYLCENPNDEGCTHMVMWSHVTNTAFGYKNVKHIKPTITIEELAERADIDLNEYEIVE